MMEFLQKINPFKKRKIPLKEVLKRNPEIDLYKTDFSEITDQKGLKPFFSEWHTMLLLGNFQEIEDFMKWVNPGDMSLLSMMALCRITSSWKHQIPSWFGFVDKVEAELEYRGIDPEREMVGLLQPTNKKERS